MFKEIKRKKNGVERKIFFTEMEGDCVVSAWELSIFKLMGFEYTHAHANATALFFFFF